MYYLEKTINISSCHNLNLPYDSPCRNVHGHNWKITVYCKSEGLDENGMIIDFKDIKKKVMLLDHANINDLIDQPTAENIARWLCDNIPFCYKVAVQETEGSVATYEV